MPFTSTLMGPLCQQGKASQRWGALANPLPALARPLDMVSLIAISHR